jgi:protease II
MFEVLNLNRKMRGSAVRAKLILPMWVFSLSYAPLLIAGQWDAAPREPYSVMMHGTVIEDDYHWMTNLGDLRLHSWVDGQNDRIDRAFDPIRISHLGASIRADMELAQSKQEFLDELLGNAKATSQTITPGMTSLDRSSYQAIEYINPNYSFTLSTDFGSDMKVWQVSRSDRPGKIDLLVLKFSSILSAMDDDIIYVTDRDYRTNGSRAVVARHKFGTSQLQDEVIFQAPSAESSLYGHRTAQGDYVLIITDRHRYIRGVLNIETGEFTESILQESKTCSLLDLYRGDPLFYCLREGGAQVLLRSTEESNLSNGLRLPKGIYASASLLVDDQLFLISQVAGRQGVMVLHLESGQWQTLVEPTFANLSLVRSAEALVLVRTFGDSSAEFVRSRDFSFQDSEVIYRGGRVETEVIRVEYTAHNGWRVPIYITKRKGQTLTEETPVFMYGYGGFGHIVEPSRGLPVPTWIEQGGVLATVVLPGGGEFGEEWLEAGRLLNKKNVFDDFARAAQRLIALGFTKKEKLAIGGTSNGGLLAAATAHFYPELFSAVIPSVGVLDFVFFQSYTAGKYWFPDYGDNRVPEEFRNQLMLSPLHQMRQRAHPATLVVTASHDDRVLPHHSYRYAAKLLSSQTSNEPVYLHTVRGGSHSLRAAPSSEQQRLNENVLGFLMRELGMR